MKDENVKKTAICLILLLNLFTANGCKNNSWYEAKPNKSQTVPATLKDMQALMDNEVLNGYSPALGEIGSDGYYISDANAKSLPNIMFNAYTWTKAKPNLNVPDWGISDGIGAYSRIFYCNVVLEGLQKISPIDKKELAEWENVKGQALFHRAKSFYELSQVFMPPYESSSSNKPLGIPLRLEADINIPSKRSTIDQTYNQIDRDLMLAKSLLPVIALFKTRPSKIAAFALLSRMYLSKEDYNEAKKYADSTLVLYNVLMDYNSLNTSSSLPIPLFNPEVIFHSRIYNNAILTSYLRVSSEVYDLYKENDLRRDVLFAKNASTGALTFKGTYSGSTFTPGFSGLATDEIYLIRAECYARAGNVKAAMDDLNNLLSTRWVTGKYLKITANNTEDAIRKIIEERRKELLLRGLRWSDLRRLNRDERFKITIERKIGDEKYILEPGSYKYTLPIPDDIIEATGINQNPMWNK